MKLPNKLLVIFNFFAPRVDPDLHQVAPSLGESQFAQH